MSYVRVELWIGEATFPRCVADMFGGDVLTITTIDDDQELETFQPGEWVRASVYGRQGYPNYTLTATTPPRRLLTRAQLREQELVAAGDPRRC